MKIAVCCSSSNEIEEKYKESSRKLLQEIFKQDNELIFGGMDSGIMGIAYNTAKQNKRKITGIATEKYKEDLIKLECNKEIVIKNVSERTEKIISEAEVLLFLPGGVGTVYELATAIEMKRSGEIDKPIIIYNETKFFDEIIQMLDKIFENKFTSKNVRCCYNIVTDNKVVIEELADAK